MIEAYKKFWKNYVNFKGRSTRSDYWYALLAHFIISFALGFVGGFLGSAVLAITTVLMLVYSLAMMIPALAICVRRLHDTGKSGWFLLLSFIPLIGGFILLIFYCLPSDQGANAYGTIE